MVKILCFSLKGCGLNPWSGNLDPTCHAAWSKKFKKYRSFHSYHLKLEAKFQKLVLIQLIIYMCEYVCITYKYL